MLQKYMRFVRGVAVNRIGLVGVVLTTSSFITFVILELARLAGLLTNAYVGLVTYLLFPALFVIGLILIPIGWRQRKRETGRTTKELLSQQFDPDETKAGLFGSRIVMTIGLFTLANVIFLGAASSRMLGFMDEPEFCGTACHSVMNPEWVTYQDSPHARVKCVECHVGEGVGALVDSKLNGTWQMISVTFDLLQRPIPTPVHQLRPARETCEKCHWPDKFYGSRLATFVSYGDDSLSTPKYTTLNLKVDAGRSGAKSGIHWHVAAENEVRYVSVDDEREQMVWVEARQADGTYKRFTNRSLVSAADTDTLTDPRTVDCIDCHNRATHIYERPDRALDKRIQLGRLERNLPFLRREAMAALTNTYADSLAAYEGIANHLYGFYARKHPQAAARQAAAIDSAIDVLRSVYYRNVHHGMNITWGDYRSHIGHQGNNDGCFRCHNPNLTAEDGSSISSDCTMCHSILAQDESRPFAYLNPPDTADTEYKLHQYLQDEFLRFMETQAE